MQCFVNERYSVFGLSGQNLRRNATAFGEQAQNYNRTVELSEAKFSSVQSGIANSAQPGDFLNYSI
jgi:hypothetical protein